MKLCYYDDDDTIWNQRDLIQQLVKGLIEEERLAVHFFM